MNASQQSIPTTRPEGPTRFGKHAGGVAEAAAHIEHTIALLDFERRHNRHAVVVQTADQHMFVFDELRNQDFVPEIDELVGFDLSRTHVFSPLCLEPRYYA
ncbi:MAG: hypothetical protein VCD50_04325 [Alphaproteobacteria bacterium]